MAAARGILTARGGMTSHAAVVARGWGKCCVVGCEALVIDYQRGQFVVEADGLEPVVVKRGDTISIDGGSGDVMLGKVPQVEPVLPLEYERLMTWADAARTLRVRAERGYGIRRGPGAGVWGGGDRALPDGAACSSVRIASSRCGR